MVLHPAYRYSLTLTLVEEFHEMASDTARRLGLTDAKSGTSHIPTVGRLVQSTQTSRHPNLATGQRDLDSIPNDGSGPAPLFAVASHHQRPYLVRVQLHTDT
jgi:hypothetical protein